MILLVSDELAVVDNLLGKLYMMVYADPREPDAWRVARERVRKLKSRLTEPLPRELVLSELPDEARPAEVERTFTEAGFLEAVKRAKEYILAGDMMQVQISQRSSRAVRSAAARALPRAARAEPVAVHVLLRLRRPSRRRRLAGDPGAARRATP